MMTKLQQELYDLILVGIQDDPLVMNQFDTDDTWEVYCRTLEADIKTMNAAELRHNIKVFKDTE